MPALVVIPARFASTRFPGKPLALLSGRPVIRHVYEKALGSKLACDVLVATDDRTIFDTVVAFGGKAVMTSPDHQSGTDRIAEAVASLDYDIIVNVQGDEPLVRPEMIDSVIALLDDRNASLGTLGKRIRDRRELFDPNVVKVVFSSRGFALYFSRAPIPFCRDEWSYRHQAPAADSALSEHLYTINAPAERVYDCYKHVGIYSYRRDVLLQLSALPPSPLEQVEKLEQLRALENGFAIKVRETDIETFGVDTPEDLERIEQWQNSSS